MPRTKQVPELLCTLQAIVRHRCAAVLDEHGTWKYHRKVRWVVEGARMGRRIPMTWSREALSHAQELLAPFSCARGKKWTNPDYCPPAPYGGYIWSYTCEMVQQVSWLQQFSSSQHGRQQLDMESLLATAARYAP